MLRKATLDDMFLIWQWRNDPITRQMSFDTEEISQEAHESWYRNSLNNRDRLMFIFQDNNLPLAFVWIDIQGNIAEVSINVSPKHRRNGYGTAALVTCRSHMPSCVKELKARIKPENAASIKAFTRAGFIVKDDEGPICITLSASLV